MFQIAHTREEKKQVALYWEQQRKIAADIKDAYDLVQEDAYHAKFYKRVASYYVPDRPERPDFMEPLVISNSPVTLAPDVVVSNF